MNDPPNILIYGNESCAYCAAARMLLVKKGVRFHDIKVSDDGRREEMERLTGSRSVPQIIINDHLVGGFDELCALDEDGDLERLLGH